MEIILSSESELDKKENEILKNLEALLKRVSSEMKEDLIPELPADRIRRENMKKKLFANKGFRH